MRTSEMKYDIYKTKINYFGAYNDEKIDNIQQLQGILSVKEIREMMLDSKIIKKEEENMMYWAEEAMNYKEGFICPDPIHYT